MGTYHFQTLYRQLATDAGVAATGGADGGIPRSRNSSAEGLGEPDKAAVDGAHEEESSDFDALIPLVAELVALENSYFC